MQPMKIKELISGKNDSDAIELTGITVPVSTLKNLMKEGYDNIKPYPSEKTVSVWGSTCTACFTQQELRGEG